MSWQEILITIKFEFILLHLLSITRWLQRQVDEINFQQSHFAFTCAHVSERELEQLLRCTISISNLNSNKRVDFLVADEKFEETETELA